MKPGARLLFSLYSFHYSLHTYIRTHSCRLDWHRTWYGTELGSLGASFLLYYNAFFKKGLNCTCTTVYSRRLFFFLTSFCRICVCVCVNVLYSPCIFVSIYIYICSCALYLYVYLSRGLDGLGMVSLGSHAVVFFWYTAFFVLSRLSSE